MSLTLRFAPSPTGYLHVGGARTAIFNWLIARQSGGKFLLRIEDTDKLRSTEESTQKILSSLKWLGLDWDGEVFFQSANQHRHLEVANLLLENGKAYRCFCTKEELEEKRRRAEELKLNQRYDGTCRNLTQQQIREKTNRGLPFAVRFKVPKGEVFFNDLIHGPMHVNNDTLDDFIIVRSDKTPVYQLAVVVDDHDMGVNLVLRGDDHISNTNKQILLYEALNWDVPGFGHLPLILGTDKQRLSKRHGAASVEEFRSMGIFSEALFNYLCLLGWSPGDDRELFTRDELIKRFSIDRINKTPAVFDPQKLLWMNAKYLAAKTADQLIPYLKPYLREKGYSAEELNDPRFLFLIELQKIRSKTLRELADNLQLFFSDPVEYEEKGVKKYFRKENSLTLLNELHEFFNEQSNGFFEDISAIETAIREFAEKRDLSAAKVIHPLRLALTGKTASPGIFELVYVVGKKKVLTRIQNAINYLKKLN
ncbi:MAG: glutamate--tRNA ligase [Calditrichaeota bacterium]|nr:glutamate--tRNA ligase [Calditrichota bacterium]